MKTAMCFVSYYLRLVNFVGDRSYLLFKFYLAYRSLVDFQLRLIKNGLIVFQ